jgi:hypothetical protein
VKYFNEHSHVKTKKDIETAIVETIPDQTFTGEQIIVIPQVRYEDRMLVFATDFTVTYSNNIQRGNAELIVHGKGEFKGKKIVTFNIV